MTDDEPDESGDLESHALIHLKGWLFLVIAVASAAIIVAWTLDWRIALLVALCAWSWSRFYYYAFYVIERYVDGRYRFAGLWSFARWWLRRR